MKFCVHPGFIRSKNDDDLHFIGTASLAGLYHLRPDQYHIYNPYDIGCKLIDLRPLYSGDYFDANERYPDE